MLTGRVWFQKVKQRYSNLEQNPKLRVIPNPWVLFWYIAEMNQRSRELGTAAAGFGQAFPETAPEKASPLLLPSVTACLKDHADKEQDCPCYSSSEEMKQLPWERMNICPPQNQRRFGALPKCCWNLRAPRCFERIPCNAAIGIPSSGAAASIHSICLGREKESLRVTATILSREKRNSLKKRMLAIWKGLRHTHSLTRYVQ